jgi:hypothetical protein
LLSHVIAFSPEAGLKISGTVVVVLVTATSVELATTLAIVVSVEMEDPLHAVNINKATGSKRFNMVFLA